METGESELDARVDAFLARLAPTLPEPAERVRLRREARLSQTEIAAVLKVSRATIRTWETGQHEPRGPQAGAYARLLEGLAKRYPSSEPFPLSQDAAVASGPPASAVPSESELRRVVVPAETSAEASADSSAGARDPHDAPPVTAGGATPTPASDTEPVPHQRNDRAPRRGSVTHAASPADDRYPGGPLAVIDASGAPGAPGLRALLPGGRVVPCPARTLTAVAAWALDEMRMGARRLDPNGFDQDPVLMLTAAAAEFLGLPPGLDDRVGLRLPAKHPVVKAIAKDGWEMTDRGVGPWARIFQRVPKGRRCVQFAVRPWEALHERGGWKGIEEFTPEQLADFLGLYAERIITPRGTLGVSGIALITALRPTSQAVKDTDGTWKSSPLEMALHKPVDPAPPEAPEEHPVAQNRAPGDEIHEEPLYWIRPFELLTPEEGSMPYAVGVDVNLAFLAAANGLVLGLGAPEHVHAPVFDKRIPGCWQVDLTGVDLDELNRRMLPKRKPEQRPGWERVDFARLPNPFTPDGLPPEEPGWYATPTLAYAAELGVDVRPIAGYLRDHPKGPYLTPWYTRLRNAYIATMADLGVRENMPPEEFLDAMEQLVGGDRVLLAMLGVTKGTAKAAFGKMRERAWGVDYKVGDRWQALERPTWRPDFRAADISAARVNLNRKMVKTAAATGRHPLAVASDCVVYAATGPSPVHALAYTDGKAAPGTFQIGVNPGYVKHEGTQSMAWALEGLDTGANIAMYVKTGILPAPVGPAVPEGS